MTRSADVAAQLPRDSGSFETRSESTLSESSYGDAPTQHYTWPDHNKADASQISTAVSHSLLALQEETDEQLQLLSQERLAELDLDPEARQALEELDRISEERAERLASRVEDGSRPLRNRNAYIISSTRAATAEHWQELSAQQPAEKQDAAEADDSGWPSEVQQGGNQEERLAALDDASSSHEVSSRSEGLYACEVETQSWPDTDGEMWF